MGQNSSTARSRSERTPSSSATVTSAQVATHALSGPDQSSAPSQNVDNVTTSNPPLIPPKQSQRLSMRKRISSIVTSSSSKTKDKDTVDFPSGSATSTPTSPRKRWRTSRRWSKAPEISEPVPAIAPIVEVVEPPTTNTPNLSQSVGGKGKAKDDLESTTLEADSVPSNQPPTIDLPVASTSAATEDPPLDLTPVRNEPSSSHNIGSWLGGDSASLARRLGLQNPEEEVVISPVPTVESASRHSSTASPTGPPAPRIITDISPEATRATPVDRIPATPSHPPPPTPQTRQFPPPGTLVVVQGVVHTTDVTRPEASTSPISAAASPISRTPSASNGNNNFNAIPSSPSRTPSRSSRPTTPGGSSSSSNAERNARNRLSTLMPRSSAVLGRSNDRPVTPIDGPLLQVPGVSHEASASNSSGESTPTDGSGTATSTNASTPATEHSSPGGISPSSIDVLGTLLSVAAAATAASLLTGSSEPIFSSGLGPSNAPTANPSTTANTDTSSTTTSPIQPIGTNRPTSPTPTAGLGLGVGFGGLGMGGSPLDPQVGPGGVGGRDRMRQVWGNLRERLGLRGGGTGTGLGDNGLGGVGGVPATRLRPDGTPMDAREIMLAEMARAFNLGLGINEEGASAQRAGTGAGARENGTGGAGRSEGARENVLPPEDSFERFLVDLQADLRVALSANPNPIPTPVTEHGQTAPVPAQTPTHEQPVGTEVAGEEPNAVDTVARATTTEGTTEHDDMPALQDDSDTESEVESPSESTITPSSTDASSPTTTATSTETSGLGAHGVTAGSTSRTEHRPGGGINWWRLYRFPPIIAPASAQAQAANTNVTATSPLAVPTSPTLPTSPTSPIASSGPSSAPAPSTAPIGSTGQNIVIPVIVVGLQSVDMNRHGEPINPLRPGATDVPDDILGGDGGDTESNLNMEDGGEFGGNDGGISPGPDGRGRRGWQNRAANALRNLRPGRRTPENAETTGGESAGSRTFLIYVIGGYYPPDHHIVTGANTLDSFEALWELAELLGQVKPPTATKEDIEKSGLQIIKPSSLEQYEKEGKVSSNCTDQCLICLDEYEPDDDVRLLECRHAFHKNCVDKWLETGRNNCPACRGKGVSTGDGLSPAIPLPAPAPTTTDAQ